MQCARRSAKNWHMVKSGTVLGSIRGSQDQCDQGWEKTGLEVHASAKNMFAGTPPLAVMHVVLYHTTSRAYGATIEEEMFFRPPKHMRKDKSIWRTTKSHAWNTGCKFMLAKIGTKKIVRLSMDNYHKHAVCWIQRHGRPVGDVPRR